MEMVKKRIALLGATGSIGKSTLQVIKEQSDKFELVLATAHNHIDDLCKLADEFKVPTLAVTNQDFKHFSLELPSRCKVVYGEEDLLSLLQDCEYDIALNAITGSAGLRSTLAILKTGKTLALANKESLVMAGHLVKDLQNKHHSKIVPVDSEHSAIFQALGKHPANEIRLVHITASGGAFRTLPLNDFDKITPEQALKHPNWDMGAKVTLDSATMFNKALEVIEAHWLFDLDWNQIKAVIHPQSVIHSMVEYVDGSILVQMSQPDMKLPILYALSYPERYASELVNTAVEELPALTFEKIDAKRYPLFYIGVKAGEMGGIMPTVANAANEAALHLFLNHKIRFVDIAGVVQNALEHSENINSPDLDTIVTVNQNTYKQVTSSV